MRRLSWCRTEEQVQEEEVLMAELRKIEMRKKERERKQQDLQKLISAAEQNTERCTQLRVLVLILSAVVISERAV